MKSSLIIMFLSLGIGIFLGLGIAAQMDKKIQIVPSRTLSFPADSDIHFFQVGAWRGCLLSFAGGSHNEPGRN